MDEELVFQYLSLDVKLRGGFGAFGGNRVGSEGTAVVLIRGKDGKWVLGGKSDFHPEGICRMVGGGIDEGEHPSEAAQREMEEEVGLAVDIDRLLPLIHAEVKVALPDGTKAESSVFVFFAQTDQELRPLDDIDRLVSLSDRELQDLADRFLTLPEKLMRQKPGAESTWKDYGSIWGPIHAAALDRVRQLSL